MPCYHPLQGWRAKRLNESGKRPVVFHRREGYSDMEVKLPCGQCIGCRLERSRQWAVRCMHEAQMHASNCFITLTYSDSNLPPNGSLVLRDFQLFMKDLRYRYGSGIRFFHCGEYGERLGRPHYHACLFNFDFPDKYLWKTHNDSRYYRSHILDELWPHGFAMLGDVTFESAAYVARYITKKVTGKGAVDHYCTIDRSTGEIISERKPEYVTMSRRPGIGKLWFDKFTSDVYPSDFIIVNGAKVKPPKYYDSQFEVIDPDLLSVVKSQRKFRGEKHSFDNSLDRLRVREQCHETKHKQLKRSFENGS